MEDGQKLTKTKLCSFPHNSHITFLLLMIISLTSGIIVAGFFFGNTRDTWINQLWSHPTVPPPRKLLKLIHEKNETKAPPPPEYESPGPYFVEYPHKYNFIINEEKRCQELKPFLVLIVPTTPQNKEDRQIIRETWGGQKVVSGRNVTLFFIVGLGEVNENELLEESKQYRDLLQVNAIDVYKNLTIKTMMMLEWLDSHCRGAAYAMKIDTDMFLNLPKLMEILADPPREDYMTGYVWRLNEVVRDPNSKWFVPPEVFRGRLYPLFTSGQGYVLSLDLPRKLLQVANREKRAFYIEDVYLGMCLQRLGLQPTEPPINGMFPLVGPWFDRCTYSKIVSTNYPNQGQKLQLWKSFSAPGPYC